MSIAELTTFLGWVFVINFAFLLVSSAMVIMLRDKVAPIHAKLFSLKEDEVRRLYFQYLGNFKILTIIFTLAPYIALKIIY